MFLGGDVASIDKLPSGRFRVRWRGADNKQHSESRASKADAEALRRQVERDLDDGFSTSTADRRLTITEYVTRDGGWLASQAWRSSTRDNFDSQWRAHLEPRWGHVVIRSVRRTDVQGWVNELSATGLAPGTVAGVYKRLVQILRAAHLDGVLTRQPVMGVTLPEQPATATKTLQVPTLENVRAMAGAVPDRYEALVWTCATLGLRPAEAVGLTVERVDFVRGVATIDRQLVTPASGAPRFGPLKTRRMPSREVPVPAELIDRLAAHIQRYPSIELETPANLGGMGSLIFSNAVGHPIARSTLATTWQKAAKRAELPENLRGWHSLRHFAITRLIGAGVNPDYVRQFAGHSTLTETLNTYTGWWPSDADNARVALTAALRELETQPPRFRST